MLSCNVFCCAHSPPSTPSTPVKLQFFESLNPLRDFQGSDDLETYMWKKSLELEPKDVDKCDFVKPTRLPQVLKSPGIKPPKNLTSISSAGNISNHYGRYRRSGRSSATANNYSPGNMSETFETSPASPNNVSVEEKNNHFGVVDINPGQSPRYLGDVCRGLQPSLSPTSPPPLKPRLRRQKAASTPPSPHISNSFTQNSGFNRGPPLFPRKRSPNDFITNSSSLNHNQLFSLKSKEGTRFVFPPPISLDGRFDNTSEFPTTSTVPTVPPVPPRKKGDTLPPPLPLDTVRTICDGDNVGENKNTSHVIAASTSNGSASPPPLFPRHSSRCTPPPRPPKNGARFMKNENCILGGGDRELNVPPSAPPLPPKTYKHRQRP
uniref:WH2 domain-containing protein n=1 Tax=Syphacia muris TaxID=451379 RepID=A0A158R467_9BILA